jgi:hypothetical protein
MIKPSVDEVMPLQCFACGVVFNNGDHIGIRKLVRDSGGYNWRWLDNRNFEDIIFDGTVTYALCKMCDFFK